VLLPFPFVVGVGDGDKVGDGVLDEFGFGVFVLLLFPFVVGAGVGDKVGVGVVLGSEVSDGVGVGEGELDGVGNVIVVPGVITLITAN
jgi:hypothetical protein